MEQEYLNLERSLVNSKMRDELLHLANAELNSQAYASESVLVASVDTLI